MVLVLQDEIRRSRDSRYDHRLHAVLLVAQGMSCPEVGRLLGDAPRTVEYWVHQFEEEGLSGLVDLERPGRTPRLGDEQFREIGEALRQSPLDFGLGTNIWDGKTLSAFIRSRYDIALGVRQCQRLFRQLGFRMRKPRPVIARADPERQEEYKKTPSHEAKRGDRSVGIG
ncbi:winged helix-turn-helix domain-containing protein [Desulfatirhabdium butyrativorans]|uniref:winged helix-turn-helix domain-containing protein n=1 Tax=Desulfatirhabdium butyrativorans TaxID=340467 RepID=UPI003CCBEBBD